ncbi:MAG: TolC family protein [Bacillota bacterium]
MKKRILIIITTLCFTLGSFISGALAEDNEKLTLEKAIAMALERNRDLKIAKLNYDKADEQLEDLKDTVKYLPDGVYIPGVSSAYGSFLSAEANERITEKSIDNMKQLLVVDVKNKYYEVLKNNRLLKLNESALKVAELKEIQAATKYNLGIITQADLFSAQTQRSNAQTNLANAKTNLETSKTNLANIIGLNESFTAEDLVDDVVYEKGELPTLEALTALALSQQYDVWASEYLAEVSGRVQEYMDNYNVGKIDTKIQEVNAGKTKEKTALQVETLYLSLQYMEQAYKTQEQNVKTLEEVLRVTRVQKEAGIAINLQVQEAEQAYLAALDEFKKLVYTYDTTKTQLAVIAGENVLGVRH